MTPRTSSFDIGAMFDAATARRGGTGANHTLKELGFCGAVVITAASGWQWPSASIEAHSLLGSR